MTLPPGAEWVRVVAIGMATERSVTTRLKKDSISLSRVGHHIPTEIATERSVSTRLKNDSRARVRPDDLAEQVQAEVPDLRKKHRRSPMSLGNRAETQCVRENVVRTWHKGDGINREV